MKKINKNLQDFFGSNNISFTLLTMTQNIVKSDFTSFIEEDIYMQPGEHSGVKIYVTTARNNRTLAWRVGHEPLKVNFFVIKLLLVCMHVFF